MFYDPEVIDYSTPYKTFNELCDGDTVFLVDYKKLEITEYNICDYSKKKSNDYYKKNCFEIKFKISLDPKSDVYESITIYDGNTFLYRGSTYKNLQVYFVTDKRIADTILEMFKSRNHYQWDMFSEIFGNPLSGKYESKHIRLH